MTLNSLKSFIARRNGSEIHTNFQFQADAEACRVEISDLGKAERQADGTYAWKTKLGKLVERNRKLSLLDGSGRVVAGVAWIEPAS